MRLIRKRLRQTDRQTEKESEIERVRVLAKMLKIGKCLSKIRDKNPKWRRKIILDNRSLNSGEK